MEYCRNRHSKIVKGSLRYQDLGLLEQTNFINKFSAEFHRRTDDKFGVRPRFQIASYRQVMHAAITYN
jgi:hypothetical protein